MTAKIEIFTPPPKKLVKPKVFHYGAKSKAQLKLAHPLLQKLFAEAIKHIDIQILQSQRGEKAQEEAFRLGHSRAHFGQSAHNWEPSIALDVCLYPLDWEDRPGFLAVQAIVGWYDPKKNSGHGLAKTMKIPIIWGGDWDSDGDLTDQKLIDLPHYELRPWRSFAKESKLFGTK